MKKIFTAILLGGLVLQQLAFSQTNDAGTNGTTPVTEIATNSSITTGETTPAFVTNEMTATSVTTAAETMLSTNGSAPVVVTNETTTTSVITTTETVVSTNETAATPDTNTTTAIVTTQAIEVVSTNTTEAASIPLIQFSDVPITTAIENLARQAGINYLLDPRIAYGQPDANGQIKPEPTLSIRWENITAQHALLALLDNYNLQLVEDMKTKISRITTKDPTAPPPLITRVIQLKYASVSNMVEAVASALSDKRSHVVSDARTSQLVVIGTEREQTDVDALINQLDKPTKQVLIETRLIQISKNPSTSKGVDWSGTLQGQNVVFGNNSLPGIAPQAAIPASAGPPPTLAQPATAGTIGGILNSGPGILANTASGLSPSTFFLNADGVKAVLSFLNADADVQIISTPRVVTLDNETARIAVTRAYPVFATTAGTQGSPGGSQVTYSNLGTILIVTPRISANDFIWLKVYPEVSSIFGTATKTVGGVINQADIYDFRTIDTQVLIPNNNTLVMGGLVKDGSRNGYNSVPVLGQIPVLGLAFRHEDKSLEKDDLMIFITPTIVKDTDFQPTKSKFLQQRPTEQKPVLKPDSLWNSAKAKKDWSSNLGEGAAFDDSLLQPPVTPESTTTNAPAKP